MMKNRFFNKKIKERFFLFLPPKMNSRKIIHIDMDAFYASVEQLDNPELKGKPIAVGGGYRGVVAAASYEARKFGVCSAMPTKIAQKKCPELIFIKPRFDRYKEISLQIREIFYEYTDWVEPLSLDEAYLDVTENKKNMTSATLIAKEIRQKIFQKTGLTASAGISVNKFLAKVGSDIHKPNGQKTIIPSKISDFLEQLPIEKFYGIGKVTTHKMYQLGIYKGKDLKEKSIDFLNEHFGKKSAQYYYQVVRGIHQSEVKPHRTIKSIGVEHTYAENIYDQQELLSKIETLSRELKNRMDKKNKKGKTLTLKIKYKDFSVFTRSKTQVQGYESTEEMIQTALSLWTYRPFDKAVRLLGLSISNFQMPVKKSSIQLKIPFDFFYYALLVYFF